MCESDEDNIQYFEEHEDSSLEDILSEFGEDLTNLEYDENAENFFDYSLLIPFHEDELPLNPPDLKDYEIRYEANLRFDVETGYFIEIECYGLPQKLNVINPEITIQSHQHPEKKYILNEEFGVGGGSVAIAAAETRIFFRSCQLRPRPHRS